MAAFIRQLGTPARPYQTQGYYKGRQKGHKVTPALRSNIFYEAKNKNKKTEAVV